MKKREGRKRWRERLLVMLIALSPFILLEAGLWIFGYEGLVDDPYRGFVGHDPIFVRDGDLLRPDPGRRDVKRRQPPFSPKKPAGTFRIFCVGDSTTWGWPGDQTVEGYPEMLRRTLGQRYPDLSIEVIHCGVVRFASYRLVGVVREVLQYEPDLITVLAGSSEFLEARSYREWRERREREASWIRNWKTLGLLRDLVAGAGGKGREGEELAERDAYMRADFIDEKFIVRDAEEVRDTLIHAAHNIRELVRACREAKVPLVLCTSPCNLRFPPFVTRYESEASQEALEPLVERTEKLILAGRAREAADLLLPAIEKDAGAAALRYQLGRAWDHLQDSERAARAYLRAKELDAFPHRTLTRFNEFVRDAAAVDGVFLVDLVEAFAAAVPDGIPDDRLFRDNCHFTPAGHEIVSRLLLKALGGLLE